MPIQRHTLLSLAAAIALIAAPMTIGGSAQAQQQNRGDKPVTGNSGGGGGGGGGFRGPGWGVVVPGLIMAIPHLAPPPPDREIYDEPAQSRQPRRPPPQTAARRGPSGAPPANENRLVPDEVVIELRNTVRPQQIDTLQRRHRLTRIESQVNQLSGTTLYRWRIPDRRSVAQVVRELEANNLVVSAQPNYLYKLQQSEQKPAGDPAQYELAKLRLPEAHALAQGDGIRVAVIDSGIDTEHDELKGSVTDYYNALATPMAAHNHGTAIAALIAGHGKLLGAAPKAKILAIRAFDPKEGGAEGTTFAILKGIDWAAANKANVINMSFAGPNDPAIRRSLEAAYKKGIVLVAAAGNEGPASPPLYPAAYPDVIAVTATDAEDKLFAQSNRGRHIAVAAPGDQMLVAIPNGYEVSSGTSYSAAEISGIVALMLERDGRLTPAKVRAILLATARDLGPKGRDPEFGAGLVDAMEALSASGIPVSAASSGKRPVERVSTGTR
ncbi:MAG TPA: S8 family serine peptidase [Pseudolabrys sp.]|nr:S8 family serine peptidase [Pseudolabrys sp.]